MEKSAFVRVKICCISSIDETLTAIKYGASALGLVSEMPSGPGVIDENLIAKIISIVPPPIATFLLTSKQTADEIITQQRRTLASTLQLVDFVPFNELKKIRKTLAGIKLVQVIHVLNEKSVEEAEIVENYVDALLLDSGNPTLGVKQLGGTGITHNWDFSKKIRESVGIPVFLAGGLKSENALDAIDKVNPFALDICSGVRTDGKLDEEKLILFFNKVHNYNASSK
jgi:phosphoribosylanthranilate isomerase